MQLFHEIELPQPESFYTTPLIFDILVDSSACGSFIHPVDGTPFTIGAPTILAPLLTAANETQHSTSIESISIAALRFFRSDNISVFAPTDYAAMLFLTRYQWGLTFQTNVPGSHEHRPKDVCTLHSEAVKNHTEQFAYGLAVHFVATLLGIPIDRFFFRTDLWGAS